LTSCSGTSRKTRIETIINIDYELLCLIVAVELPEKQGLKQYRYNYDVDYISGCSGTSRKTRIETWHGIGFLRLENPVAVELPEKQGLKL